MLKVNTITLNSIILFLILLLQYFLRLFKLLIKVIVDFVYFGPQLY